MFVLQRIIDYIDTEIETIEADLKKYKDPFCNDDTIYIDGISQGRISALKDLKKYIENIRLIYD